MAKIYWSQLLLFHNTYFYWIYVKIVDNDNKNEPPLWNKRVVIVTVYIKLKLHVVVVILNIFDYTEYATLEKHATSTVYYFQVSVKMNIPKANTEIPPPPPWKKANKNKHNKLLWHYLIVSSQGIASFNHHSLQSLYSFHTLNSQNYLYTIRFDTI